MNSYDLSRNWFEFAFQNPDKIKPIHTALYFFVIEQCNRMGWKEKFGLPTDMAMEALGVKNWRTYSNALNTLEVFGFIDVIEKSKNQWTATIIAIVKNTKARTEALSKARTVALSNHIQKHGSSTYKSIGQSIADINKLINNKPLNKETIKLINNKPLVFFDFINNNCDLIFLKEKKESCEKEKTEIYPTGDDFWNEYDKKVGNETKIKEIFSDLPYEKRLEVITHVQQYVLSTPDKKYRKNPQNYLEEEYWKSEIIIPQQNEQRFNNKKTVQYSDNFKREIFKELQSK